MVARCEKQERQRVEGPSIIRAFFWGNGVHIAVPGDEILECVLWSDLGLAFSGEMNVNVWSLE
jgi:hypothetical protein